MFLFQEVRKNDVRTGSEEKFGGKDCIPVTEEKKNGLGRVECRKDIPSIEVGVHCQHNTNSSKIGENLNVKSCSIPEIKSSIELSQNQNINLLKKIKQIENKSNKTNKQKKKEKKKDQKSSQFLKKFNVGSIEATCSQVSDVLCLQREASCGKFLTHESVG